MSSVPMLSWREAQSRLLSLIQPLSGETVELSQGYRRYLLAPVVASVDLPPFDNSAMDGYAVRAADTALTGGQPARLTLSGRSVAGEPAASRVEPGSCVRIFTGSVVPAGADAVVMQEDTTADGKTHVIINTPVTPWENIRFRGEDVRHGDTAIEAGCRLGSQSLALLGALGVHRLVVGARPRVRVLATGSELQEGGSTLRAGAIFESNRLVITTLLRDAGADAHTMPVVPDTLVATREALIQAFQDCEAVVTTGGVSVGELDLVKAAFADLGGEIDFWRVALRPGKPFLFGRLGDKVLFGLPGNPVSAMVTALLFVCPAVARWQGSKTAMAVPESRLLGEPLANPGARAHFVRVKLDAEGNVISAGRQGSHLLRSVADSLGLVEIPPETTLARGAAVSVWPWP